MVSLLVVGFFPQCRKVTAEKKAKYVFYFIGDGMGVNQVAGTEMFMAEKEGRIGIKPLNFTQFPVNNFATTYSVYNAVTCSAAAGTALACGEKTKNGTIGMDSLHQAPLYSVAVKAKKAGKKVGIATTVSIDHATPAAFYAHQPSRKMYYEIATDLPETGFDFYAGAGFLQPVNKKDSAAVRIYDLLKDSGYSLIKGPVQFARECKTTDKMVYIQAGKANPRSLPYAIDRKAGDLTLTQMTADAIDFLSRDSDNGFFLMVEGGKIDWACHDNDAATVFQEIVDLSEAVGKALDFYRKHPEETLIVVTADHETGGIVLGNGAYALNLGVLKYQKVSQVQLTENLRTLRQEKGEQVSWEDVRAVLMENLGFWDTVELSEKQEKELKDVYEYSFKSGQVKTEKKLYSSNDIIAVTAVRIIDDIAMVGWVCGGHSAGVVPVFAIGCGSSLFQGKLDNTDIPRKIEEAAGL